MPLKSPVALAFDCVFARWDSSQVLAKLTVQDWAGPQNGGAARPETNSVPVSFQRCLGGDSRGSRLRLVSTDEELAELQLAGSSISFGGGFDGLHGLLP